MKTKQHTKPSFCNSLQRLMGLVVVMVMGMTATLKAQTTYQYYCLHKDGKGYLKQYKGIVGNENNFRYDYTHADNGSSIWVYSSDGYLQQEMYYLNVLNGKTLVLSITPETQWDLVDDGDKKRFQMRGSNKILGLDNSNKPTLTESPAAKYAACTLTVTENNNKWDGPKNISWTVQSPQLVTYLRTYYLRNITVTIDKNDAGTANVKVVDAKDSGCYCSLTYDETQPDPTGKGTNWDINTTTGIIYNLTGNQQTVNATYTLTPLDPIVLTSHAAATATVTIKVNAKAFTPADGKKYLLFNTQDNSYRFPKATSSLSEGDLLPVNGKQSDLTEAVNGEIAWDVEVDAEGFCLFKNVSTGQYFYYDAADYTVSDYGAVKIGSASPSDGDNSYRFRLYSGCGNRDPFEDCFYIIPYDKQFAVWKSDGVLGEHYFALYMNTSNQTKIASIYKTSDNAKWNIYAYDWEYRLWDNYSIIGDPNLYATGSYNYTASTWFSRNIVDSPVNSDYCLLPGSKTRNGITYDWTLTDLTNYISISDNLASGTSTLTATVNSLPPGTRTGTLKVTAKRTDPDNRIHTNNKSILVTLYNLNPTLTEIASLSDITEQNGLYKLTGNNTYSDSNKPSVTTFSGTLDGGGYTISGISQPLFETLAGGTVRNLNFSGVNIGGSRASDNVGTVCSEANGAARIYNVGVLDGTVGGAAYTGGLVGLLDGEARVVNCFSYADITSGTTVGGIVGYNNVATTWDNLKTMVFNCMFYGDIDVDNTTNRAPVYNGKIITNRGDQKGVSNYNFCRAEAPYVTNRQITTANCALLAETRFLQRFEFFRHLLNSHRELAAWWISSNVANTDLVQKWVMLPDSIGTEHPYPILKPWGKYPSVVNIDAANAQENQPRNKGGKLGTLTVNIQMGDGNLLFDPAKPSEAAITTPSLTLNITDKDPDHFNFNYAKVQLPYYNDVGTHNYNDNRVVTGWKIVSIEGGTEGTFSTGEDAPAYNFADRNCTKKDLYSVSGRVFNQGAYWDVPEGVTAITIEPYWAKAAYCADNYRDKVYNQAMSASGEYVVTTVGGGQMFTNGGNLTINGQSQKVFSSIGNARNDIGNGHSAHTVYDYAIVLVGNTHNTDITSSDLDRPYTIMSADLNGDNEPDYCYILRFDNRKACHPVRVDFLIMPGLGMAQKSTGGTGSYNFGILQPISWFESTNTSLFRVTQFEYDRTNRSAAPLILQGGVIEQWVSGQSNNVANTTTYFHVGGNVWFKEFHRGTHQDQTYKSKHPPISVTGGDYDEFYLTGLYRGDVANYDDNAECYINGGRFGIVAGTGMEGIGNASTHANGNITWQIQNADITEFYGGGINAAKPAQGNISTTITNSYIDQFCGGPKFGDMSSGKTVTTTATNCTFGTFFGAGYGGNSYSRQAPQNQGSVTNANPTWNTWIGQYYKQEYNSTYGGVSTQFKYQFLPNSNNTTNVARIFIEYVKFSLATCHTVTSTLTGCTVTGNFFGGGSLGKVDGTVTSSLTDCTLQGSAFGAGFSATLPTVEVDAIGFLTEPYYYTDFGTFRTGVWDATTTYTWQHANTVNNTATAIDKTNHILYTTEDLNTLGTVGDAVITLKGTTRVNGNVYGGGDQSGVIITDTSSGNTTVILEGEAHVLGNVYGGGNNGAVGGDSKVEIKDARNTGN